MTKHGQQHNGFKLGDKVRIKTGPHAGTRGSIHAEANVYFEIETREHGTIVVEPNEVTNYSLAARRAWAEMPKRAGRPPSDPAQRKKMVSMRLDVDVWQSLGRAVELGLIANREQAINAWIREHVDPLMQQVEL